MQNLYVTTPIYYVNAKPHIGHAYTSIAADVIKRFFAMLGTNCRLTTGTDEHGQKIFTSAKNTNTPTIKFVDSVSQHFKSLAAKFNIDYCDFIRTTEARHKKTLQFFWDKLLKNGHIYLGKYSGWYCQRDEAFYTESELIDKKSPTGAPVEWLEEESYFFRLSDFEQKLLDFYDKNPDFILPKTRQNEVVSFVSGGLQDLSISRKNLSWGIKVPQNHDHVIYVWLDALTNYLSSLGFSDAGSGLYQDFWKNADIVHVIGKDILRFHAVYWPAFLMAAELPLPKTILTHGWWTNRGEKISKSVGNVIDPIELLKDFDVDCIRYFLMKEISFGSDGNFSTQALKTRVNADLANNIGNLIQRTLKMIVKNCDSKIPNFNSIDLLPSFAYNACDKFKKYMQNFEFHNALDVVLQISGKANEYIDQKKPWSLLKTNINEAHNVLYNITETIRCIGIMLLPFVPDSATKILDSISVPEHERTLNSVKSSKKIAHGTKIPDPSVIFVKYQ